MEFSVFPISEGISDIAVTRTLWQEAERLGYAAIWNEDNVYPHPDDVVDRNAPIFDCWTTLSALAGCTSTIRFGSMVFPAPRRHPALLAKAVSSLDVISGGRLTMGFGAGDPSTKRHYSQWGMPFPSKSKDRYALLEEHLQVQKLLYTQESANFQGEYFQLDDAVNSPKPLQNPHPPLWVGLNKRATDMALIAAKHANGIIIEWGDDEVASTVVPAVEAACESVGRDPAELTKARFCMALVTDGSCTKEEGLRELSQASADHHVGYGPALETWLGVLCGTPDELVEQIRTRVEGLGFDHLMCHFFSVGLNSSSAGLDGLQGRGMMAMHTFADSVMPAFQSASPHGE